MHKVQNKVLESILSLHNRTRSKLLFLSFGSALQSRYRTGSVIICFYCSSSKRQGKMPDSLTGKEREEGKKLKSRIDR